MALNANANLFRSVTFDRYRRLVHVANSVEKSVESNITGSKTLVHENRSVKMEKRAEEEEYFCSRE